MNERHYRIMIVRAVNGDDGTLLTMIAAHLEDCERAKQMLIAKGYGTAAMKTGDIVRMVPDAEMSGHTPSIPMPSPARTA